MVFRQRVLVLETTGRTTGKRRRTTLTYRELDGGIVVVGGAGGQSRPPDWVANLRADSRVVVTRHRSTTRMAAQVLADDQRRSAWERLLPGWPMISTYQNRAGYPIPVVMITPLSPKAQGRMDGGFGK